MTVNETLVLMQAVRGRIGELSSLRDRVATRDHYYGSAEKEVTPEYDVKKVDAKIVELRKFMLLADMKIKQSNALTQIALEANVDMLLEPLV